MNKLAILAGIAAVAGAAAPVTANHLLNLQTPYDTRGQCESAVADFNSDDRDGLLERFSTWFHNRGDAQSLLTRAFPCEYDDLDGEWYITNHLGEVLDSDWYKDRH